MISPIRLIRTFLSLILLLCVSNPVVAQSEPNVAGQIKPNVVLVFMDNFGWGEPGFNGGGIIRGTPTPRMDQLAAEGLRLTNFNVEAQCTPSRAAIMTGRYAIRSGNAAVPVGEGVYGLVRWEYTMAEMFSDAGYATAMYGKWHLGRTKGRFPSDQGFDEWYGVPNTTDESTWTSLPGFKESGLSPGMIMEGRKGQESKEVRVYDLEYRARIDGDLTDKAIDFMQRNAKSNKPFFLYLPYTATHFPTRPHPDFVGKTGNGAWADLLYQIDQYLGRLLDEVDKLGIRDNTILIFTSDNGPEALEAGTGIGTVETGYPGSAGPWRGTMFTGYEGSLRVPFAMRWPGRIQSGSVSDEIVHEMDLFPTLAKLVGGKVPTDRAIDGVDQSEFFLGKQKKSNREGVIVYMGSEIFGVKWRNWKLHFKALENIFGRDGIVTFDTPKLYNLLTDVHEHENVIFPYTWVPRVALRQLDEHAASFKKYPPIKMGTPDPYQPPK